ncbi:MAG: 2-hydroxyacid dehydrogenase [Granulosicoccus sp.]
MNILFYCEGDDGSMLQALKERLTDHTIYDWNTQSFDKSGIEAAIVWLPPAQFFDGLGNLKTVFALAAGVDQILENPELPPDVLVVRLQDAGMSVQMEEYVLYGVLHAQRHFHEFRSAQLQRQWIHGAGVRPAADFNVGLLGAGALGIQVARRLKANGYAVSCWTRTARTLPEGISGYSGKPQLDSFLSKQSVLVCLLPLTEDTRGILDKTLLDRLPKGAFLINVARGAHLVEEDLLTSLDTGQLSGAMLDVFQTEPLPQTHPFWVHPRITVTPHEAANSLADESVLQILFSIRLLENGQLPPGAVDRMRGY